MTKITIDQETRAKLSGLREHVELCDETGNTIGYFLPTGVLKHLSPLPDEEIERRREKRSGRPLRDILRELEVRRWTT